MTAQLPIPPRRLAVRMMLDRLSRADLTLQQEPPNGFGAQYNAYRAATDQGNGGQFGLATEQLQPHLPNPSGGKPIKNRNLGANTAALKVLQGGWEHPDSKSNEDALQVLIDNGALPGLKGW